MAVQMMSNNSKLPPNFLAEEDNQSIRSATSNVATGPDTPPELPFRWKMTMAVLTCFCTFGNHWSNGLIVALKTTIIKNFKINNSEFATLVSVTNLINVFLCVCIGLSIDRWGGPLLSAILAAFHLCGAVVMAGSATNHLNSYPLLVLGKVIAAIGDGSLDNAQHRIFSTYFAPGKGFAFSIGVIWSIANLAQFVGHASANIIARDLGSYAWPLWVSAAISLFSLLCAVGVLFLDNYLRRHFIINDKTGGGTGPGLFEQVGLLQFSTTFWIVVLFCVFENAGVQSFVSISTQLAQQRLKKGAVVGGWVSSFYLLLPAVITPFLGIFIDAFGRRVSILFMSGVFFLIAMLLLKLSHSIPTFVAAYVFYALAQSVTPAPQVEIIRSIIPDPKYYATGFSIKKSCVQASIVIITIAAGRLQDMSHSSLDPGVTLWLVYAAISVLISGAVLFLSYSTIGMTLLPAVRLAEVPPPKLEKEVERLWGTMGLRDTSDSGPSIQEKERILKSTRSGTSPTLNFPKVLLPCCGFAVILVGWVLFALGVVWGVHGSVTAGTVGE